MGANFSGTLSSDNHHPLPCGINPLAKAEAHDPLSLSLSLIEVFYCITKVSHIAITIQMVFL
jgi:hypothetical protein